MPNTDPNELEFYVVEHPDGFSVQSKEGGGGLLLGANPETRREAEIARDAANQALDIVGDTPASERLRKMRSSR